MISVIVYLKSYSFLFINSIFTWFSIPKDYMLICAGFKNIGSTDRLDLSAEELLDLDASLKLDLLLCFSIMLLLMI